MKKTIIPLTLITLSALATNCAVEEEVKPVTPDEDLTSKVKVTEITPYSAHVEGVFGNEDDTSELAGLHYSLQNTRFISTTGDEAKATMVAKGRYALDLHGLYADTTYYFTTFVERDGTRYNSGTYKFHTHRLTATTSEVTDIYAYGAQLGLRLSEDIDAEKFKGSFGIYYSTRPRVIRESSTLATAPYAIKDLLPNHDYYCAAFVCQKTAGLRDVYWWSETIKFTTPELAVETHEPEEQTTFSADLCGSTNAPFSDVEEIGFLLFERNRDVTIDSVSAASDQQIIKIAAENKSASGHGDFSSLYTNLKSNKRYFYRAYAVINARDGKGAKPKPYYGTVKEFRTNAITLADGESADMGLSVIWATKNHGAKSVTEIGTLDTPQATENSTFDSGWRKPTLAEAKELVDSCHWAWCTYKGVNGAMVTEKSGRTIFIPANQKIGDAYTYGVYMVDEVIDDKGRVPSFRFVQDANNDNECQKTSDNVISAEAVIGIRLVRDK